MPVARVGAVGVEAPPSSTVHKLIFQLVIYTLNGE